MHKGEVRMSIAALIPADSYLCMQFGGGRQDRTADLRVMNPSLSGQSVVLSAL
jgi:hypothetical protein